MPIEVRHPPQSDTLPAGHHQNPLKDSHEHDLAAIWHRNAQHKEALRLALGSILTPKRPYSQSSSRSSSGHSTPAHPFSHPLSFTPATSGSPSNPPVPPPPHPTPTHSYGHGHPLHLPPFSHSHSHPHSHSHSHLHPPSRLSRSQSYSTEQNSPETLSSPLSTFNAEVPQECPPVLARPGYVQPSESKSTPDIHAPAPMEGRPATSSGHRAGLESLPGSGTGTPKAKFIETLQSKSAWDALIHGSFS